MFSRGDAGVGSYYQDSP